MQIITNTSTFVGAFSALAFLVNIIVQVTKPFIPLPTKLWCILTSITVNFAVLTFCSFTGIRPFSIAGVILAFFSAFVVAYVAMYGFDTLKELWTRFKEGENINEDN